MQKISYRPSGLQDQVLMHKFCKMKQTAVTSNKISKKKAGIYKLS